VFALAAVILNILRDFVLAALSVFVDDRDNRHCVSAKAITEEGQSPLKLEAFQHLNVQWKLQN